MSKSKKYRYRVIQMNNTWKAEIVRKISAREDKVSKSQDGFSSQAEASEWGEKELKVFLTHLSEKNKRRSNPGA